tara:strand:+ start:10083 stop:10331 length:249 start_codon:yes stop_codon:yes gene_type:complete
MKTLSILIFLFATTAFAQGQGGKWEARKATVLENADKRIAAINELKTCVSGAEEKEAFRSCVKAHKEKMKTLRMGKKYNKGN